MEDFFEQIETRPKPNVFRKIYLWWRFEGRYYHRDFVRGIEKLWYWFPIIWKDRDWDQHYIYEVIKHKLKAQAKYISNNDRHTRAQLDAKRMTLCVKLMQLCQDEPYTMEYMDYAKDKHWFAPCNDGTDSSTWESENIWENYEDFFKKYPLIYKRVLNGEGPFNIENRDDDERKKVIAMNIGHINQSRAHKLLFKIMQENIERWWD